MDQVAQRDSFLHVQVGVVACSCWLELVGVLS